MTIQRLLSALFMAFVLLPLHAQENDGRKTALAVKKDSRYLYGEGVDENEATAYDIAKEKLTAKIQAYVAERPDLKNADGFLIENVKSKTKKVTYERTIKIKVVCVYIDKADITPLHRTDNKPKTPVVQEPKPESKPQPKSEPVPLPASQPASQPETPVVVPAPMNGDAQLPYLVQTTLAMQNYAQLKDCLEHEKQEHRNIMYKLVKGDVTVKNCYWYVFNAEREIIAVFDKTGTRNLQNGKSARLTDYLNYPKLWLQIYE